MRRFLLPCVLFIFALLVGVQAGAAFPVVSIASADEFSSSSYSSMWNSSSSMMTSFSSYSYSASSEISSSTISSSSDTSSSGISSESSSASSTMCGNWTIDGTEECDDGPSGSDTCSTTCLALNICHCECGLSGTKLCQNKKEALKDLCLNIKMKDIKTEADCKAQVGNACRGYYVNTNNAANGTLTKCFWAKPVQTSSDSSGEDQCGDSICDEWENSTSCPADCSASSSSSSF